jgi:hypothetical protein
LFALQQLVGDVRIACSGNKRGEPIEPRNDAVLDLSGWDVPRPTDEGWRTETAFERRALATGERSLSAIRPGEVFGSVVGSEDDDCVVINA